MAIKYGPLSEYLPAAPCGIVIPEDIPKLQKAGNLLWHACYDTAQAIDVVVRDATQPEPMGHLPILIQRTGVSEEVKKIVQEIYVEVGKSLVLFLKLIPCITFPRIANQPIFNTRPKLRGPDYLRTSESFTRA